MAQALEERLVRLQAEGQAREERLARVQAERDSLRASLRDAQAVAKQAAAGQRQLQRRLASAEKAAEGTRAKGEAAAAAAAAAQQQAARLAGELAEARAALQQRQEDARALGAAEREALTLRVAAMQVGASVAGQRLWDAAPGWPGAAPAEHGRLPVQLGSPRWPVDRVSALAAIPGHASPAPPLAARRPRWRRPGSR